VQGPRGRGSRPLRRRRALGRAGRRADVPRGPAVAEQCRRGRAEEDAGEQSRWGISRLDARRTKMERTERRSWSDVLGGVAIRASLVGDHADEEGTLLDLAVRQTGSR
jgi:hypothetical protein